MHIVIVAGGLGSRLAPLTNHIPKFLVNIGKETGFVEQIRYWADYYPQSITVIVHSVYADLVKAYYDLYFKGNEKLFTYIATAREDGEYDEGFVPTPFIVKTVDTANGSAHAIFSTCEHLDKQPVMFTWCDVLPACPLDIEELNCGRPLVFLNYDHPNRYDLVQVGQGHGQRVPALRSDGRGGIFGMYYVPTYSAKPFNDGQDFVEILPQYSNDGYVQGIEVPAITDFGDKPKLDRVRDAADGARSFNSVKMHGDLVLKRSLNDQGNVLIKREIAWYDELLATNSSVSRPTHWAHRTGTSFVMERVRGEPIWKVWPTLDSDARNLVLNRLFEQLDLLHAQKKSVGNDVVLRDVKLEARDKLLARYAEIKDVINAFGPITVVNGQELKIKNPTDTIELLHGALEARYLDVTEHSLIHGDLQMSNSMIDPDTLEVTLIDPRGYFGKSELYGVADYDLAKMLYSLSGYDLFNYSRDFGIRRRQCELDHSEELNFEIPTPLLGGCDAALEKFSDVHKLWLAVCWIGLAAYIKNDPVKSVAAHYHGLTLAEQTLGIGR